MSGTDRSRQALKQAELGHRVHPLEPGGKAPKLVPWQKVATTDAAQLAGWWERWPAANVGIVIGSNETVVDIDTRAAHDEFLERVGEVETTTVRTPRGGWHYLFAGNLPNKVLIRDGADRLIEVKGARTNRVAPGSVCTAETWSLAVDVPKAPLPNALIEWANGDKT